MTCSVCIATYKRPKELAACLDALIRQTELPDEIIVSDAGGDRETRDVVEASRRRQESLIRHCPTERTALPWQRWWAFQHGCGSIAVFLDDDVRLMPEALAVLGSASRQAPDIVGVGFPITYDEHRPDRAPQERQEPQEPATIRERWLGIAGARPGSITAGGITVDLPMTNGHVEAMDVEWLSGGAMSFRRDVLESIGPLDALFALYDARIGKAEDAILSSRARRHGRLLVIAGPYARHPALAIATRTANPQDGYHKGLLETWGRAHVLRWLADDPACASQAWRRIASLEVARALAAALRHPAASPRWHRLLGDIIGIGRTIRHWDHIPIQPDQANQANQANQADRGSRSATAE